MGKIVKCAEKNGYVVEYIRGIDGHFEFFVNGEFECSCFPGEYSETLQEILENL